MIGFLGLKWILKTTDLMIPWLMAYGQVVDSRGAYLIYRKN
jgi:hypothetical protein